MPRGGTSPRESPQRRSRSTAICQSRSGWTPTATSSPGHLPLTRESRGNGSAGHATTWVSINIITLPGAAGLYLRLDGHISRHPGSWSFVKNAWLDRGDPALPLLRLPVLSPYPERGRDLPTLPGFTAEVTEAIGQHAITLPAVLPDRPGPVRPIGNPRRHPIGKGPGVRFLYQLGTHATRQLQTEPLRYAKTPISVGEQHPGPDSPGEARRRDSRLRHRAPADHLPVQHRRHPQAHDRRPGPLRGSRTRHAHRHTRRHPGHAHRTAHRRDPPGHRAAPPRNAPAPRRGDPLPHRARGNRGGRPGRDGLRPGQPAA